MMQVSLVCRSLVIERPFSPTLHGAPLKNKLPALNFMKRLLLIHVDDVLHFEGKLL